MTAGSRLHVWALALIASGWVLVASPDLRYASPQSLWGRFVVGFAIGTLFGQTTVAAFWTALGSAPLYGRLLSALVWLGLLLLAIAISLRLEHVSAELPMVGVSLVTQWIVVQIPLWLLAYGRGLQFHDGGRFEAGNRQFGLSQLMIFTLGIAVLLGAARWAVTSQVLTFRSEALPVWLFLATAAILMSLPLTLAALMPKLAGLGVLLILSLIGLGTAWEHPLLRKLSPNAGGPEIMHLVWINAFTSAWVLAFALLARFFGYRLTLSQRPASRRVA
jgi:hypothetical protein